MFHFFSTFFAKIIDTDKKYFLLLAFSHEKTLKILLNTVSKQEKTLKTKFPRYMNCIDFISLRIVAHDALL